MSVNFDIFKAEYEDNWMGTQEWFESHQMHPWVAMIEAVVNHNNKLTKHIMKNRDAFEETGLDDMLMDLKLYERMDSL